LRPSAKASAPGKVILFGEQFVVHGKPALVIAIDKRAIVKAELRKDKKAYICSRNLKASGYYVGDKFHIQEGGEETKEKFEPIFSVIRGFQNFVSTNVGVNLDINSSIPVAAGLGSSAAVSVASAAALNHLFEAGLTEDEIFRISLEAEKVVHVNPSGVDPAISTYGGIILYRKGEGIKRLNLNTDLPIILGDTMLKRSTGGMVAQVMDLKKRYPSLVDKVFDAGEEIVALGIKAMRKGDLETLGELMNFNHALLCAMGVSNYPLERLVQAARTAGALGAKLTGAGGGGCIVALAAPEKLNDVAKAIEKADGKAYITRITMDGIRIEK